MPNVPALEESGTFASQGTGRGQGEGTVGEKTDRGLAACCTIFMRIEHACIHVHVHVHLRKSDCFVCAVRVALPYLLFV